MTKLKKLQELNNVICEVKIKEATNILLEKVATLPVLPDGVSKAECDILQGYINKIASFTDDTKLDKTFMKDILNYPGLSKIKDPEIRRALDQFAKSLKGELSSFEIAFRNINKYVRAKLSKITNKRYK